ncbi:MAG: hypothetical protein AAGC60_20580 [Acidobacteriota bacterium]
MIVLPRHTRLVLVTLILCLFTTLPGLADGWQRITPPDLPLADGQDVAIHPANSQLAYALIGAQAVARSTDGGVSWSTVGFAPRESPFTEFFDPARSLHLDPRRAETVMVGGFNGLWRSDDGAPFVSAGPLRQRVRAVAFGPAGDAAHGTWYLGYDDGSLFGTDDDGASWRRLAAPRTGTFAVGALAVDPRDGQRLLVLLTDPLDDGSCGPGECSGLYESTDGGTTWIARDADADGSILELAPSDPNRLLVQLGPGTLGWSADGGQTIVPVAIGAPLSGVAFDPADATRAWLASPFGPLLGTTDGGASWVSTALFTLPPTAIAAVDGLLLTTLESQGGTGPGVLRSTDGGLSWTAGEGLDAANWAQIDAIGGSSDAALAVAGPRILRTDDGGESWRLLFDSGDGVLLDLTAAPSAPSVLYAGGRAGGERLWRSVDGGTSWEPRSGDLVEELVSIVAVDPQNPDHLLVSAGFLGADGLYASADAGATWDLVLDESVFDIAFDPSAPQVVYANAFEDLYRSLDGGATWSSLGPAPGVLAVDSAGTLWAGDANSFDLLRSDDRGESFVRVGPVPYARGIGLVFDASRGADGELYFGTTDGGVLRSLDGGRSWLRLAPGLPPTLVGDLSVANDGSLWVASFGAGIYRGKFDAPPLATTSGRFLATVSWRAFDGATGTGTAGLRTDDTGTFWFFDEANLELMIKVLDGRAVNGHWWIFYGALSNVEFTLTVTDTATGETSLYFNPLGTFASAGDVEAFADPLPTVLGETVPSTVNANAGLRSSSEEAATATDKSLNVLELGGRFRASITWRDFEGETGEGVAVPLTGEGGDTGAFWFFGPQNLEMMVKVLDGRPVNGRFWVFFGSLSNVEFTLRVEDTATGAVKEYVNPLGTFASVGDVDAF